MEETTETKNKVISGEIKYEFDITDKDYGFNFNDSPNNVLAAFEITHRELLLIKENLIKNIPNLNKKDKNVAQDRLHRVTHSAHMVKLILESYINDLLTAGDILAQEKEINLELKVVEPTSVKTES